MQRTTNTTPIAIVAQNLEKYKTAKEKIVLLSTGSYNPIHRKHIDVFVQAKKLLEQQNCAVLGAYISPSHDSYVEGKLGKYAMPKDDRFKMIQDSIADSNNGDWLVLDKYECENTHFEDFPYVTKSLRAYLQQQFPKDSFRVMYLCGADHFAKCGGLGSMRTAQGGVCVLARPGYTTIKSDPKNHLYVVQVSSDESDVSSTMIRKLIMEGKDVSEFTYESVAAYIASKKWFQ